MKILKLKLYQESVCYKKPFALKVAETYPLPPYSTIIGMLCKILEVPSGECPNFDISIQGDYESIFRDYARKIKFADTQKRKLLNCDATIMPQNDILLFGVNLIIHVKGDDTVIDKIQENIKNGQPIILGRNHDLARLDYMGTVTTKPISHVLPKHNAYLTKEQSEWGLNFRLNTYYIIENDLRRWNKVDVRYRESSDVSILDTESEINSNDFIQHCEIDNEYDLVFFANINIKDFD